MNLGRFFNKAKCEPLYLKNNTVKELFMKTLNIVLGVAKIPQTVKKLNELLETNILHFFIGCHYRYEL